MDIDILSVGDLLHLIKGYYCYSPIKEDAEYLQNLLLTLIEFHGTDDEELIKGLNYYKLNIGERILLPYHDPEERKRFIEDNI